MADSRIAWASLPAGEMAMCEAPRHTSAPPPAAWRVALVEFGAEPEFHSLCPDCVEAIASDIGISVEDGRARL